MSRADSVTNTRFGLACPQCPQWVEGRDLAEATKLVVEHVVEHVVGVHVLNDPLNSYWGVATAKPDVVRLASWASAHASDADIRALAAGILRKECGPCGASWHEVPCSYHAGHKGDHTGRGGDVWATWPA